METKIKNQLQLIRDIELDIIKLKRFKLEAEQELEALILEAHNQLKINFYEDVK
jgi:hypothetical protein